MWRFEVQYQKGADNPCTDAMFRYSNAYAELASAAMMSEFDVEEAHYVGGVIEEAEKFFRVTWDDVKSETNCDNMIMLKTLISDGFPETKGEMASPIRCFWEVQNGLRIHDGSDPLQRQDFHTCLLKDTHTWKSPFSPPRYI